LVLVLRIWSRLHHWFCNWLPHLTSWVHVHMHGVNLPML